MVGRITAIGGSGSIGILMLLLFLFVFICEVIFRKILKDVFDRFAFWISRTKCSLVRDKIPKTLLTRESVPFLEHFFENGSRKWSTYMETGV